MVKWYPDPGVGCFELRRGGDGEREAGQAQAQADDAGRAGQSQTNLGGN